MQSKTIIPTLTKIPQSRAKDIEVENVIYSLHKDSHVVIHWGFKGCETGREILVPADTYNAFLEDVERFEPVQDLGAYWFNADLSEKCDDAKEYMRVHCVLLDELLPNVFESIQAIAETFPNPKTYPVPEIHDGHSAQFLGLVS